MLRGRDAGGTSADYQPTIVEVADRPPVSGSVAIYVDEDLPPSTHRRLRRVGERLSFFADAGVAPEPTVVRWPTGISRTSTDADERVVAVYEEFREAVGEDGLAPFFDRTDDGVSLPDLCVAFRRDGRLSGLYPQVKNGHAQTVEECLSALTAGNDVENVSR